VKKLLIIFLLFQTNSFSQSLDTAYFAGGCFWCMEESFEKANGVQEVISGYSGGNLPNPTYKEVTYKNTGHFETVKIIYDQSKISFERLLNLYWMNIDPFDAAGQFCDKGLSYRTVVFYQNNLQKQLTEKSIKKIEKKFNGKIPHNYESLILLDGVGNKSANVFLIEIDNENKMAVDTHVFRVSHRLGLSDAKSVEATEKDLVDAFEDNLATLHQAMVLFGRYICTAKKPKCDRCFLKQYCNFLNLTSSNNFGC